MSGQEDLQAQALKNIGEILGAKPSEQDSLNDGIDLDDVSLEDADRILAEEIALDEVVSDPIDPSILADVKEERSKPSPKAKKKSLGRGINSLLGDDDMGDYSLSESKDTLSIDVLVAGKYQPRTEFDKEAINNLVASIKEKGVLQPLLVRKTGTDKYEIIAGERRFRASKLAGLTEVPVVIKEFDDKETLEVSLVENLQRQDLNPIEEADGYQKLVDDFSHTQVAISIIVGKSRSYIANTLRLLNLPKSVINLIKDGKITAGHAKVLVGLDNALELAELAIKNDLNVRQLEEIVTNQKNGNSEETTKTKVKKDVELVKLEKDLTKSLGYKVKIKNSSKGGKLTLSYKNLEELDDLIQKLEKLSEQDSLKATPSKKEEITDDAWHDALKPDTGEKPAGEFIPEDS